MATFRTQYDRFRVQCEAGSPLKASRVGKVNKNGIVEVIETGTDNLYNEIQSHADSCDLNILLARFANGDTSALNQRVGQYLDVTGMPTSYAEAFEMTQNAADMFASLPADIKNAYDNNLGKFVSDIGSDNFNSLFNKEVKSIENPTEVAAPVSDVAVSGE